MIDSTFYFILFSSSANCNTAWLNFKKIFKKYCLNCISKTFFHITSEIKLFFDFLLLSHVILLINFIFNNFLFIKKDLNKKKRCYYEPRDTF